MNTDLSHGAPDTFTVSATSALFNLLDHEVAQHVGNEIVLLDALNTYAEVVAFEIDEAVTRARQAGRSWSSIGDALGITRQAAHQRYAPQQRHAE